MKAYRFPEYDQPIYDCRGKTVAVIGGGNTALDAIRTALRLGAKKTFMIYRRSEKEMPGRAEEIHHAKDEGIEIQTLTHPVEFLGNEKGWLTGARCIRMELGEPDDSGRRRPVPIEGSEFEIPLDVVIIAVGTGPNPLVQSTTPDLATNKWGYIEAEPKTLRTSKKGVFAGGDIVTGAATVILAMGAGRKASASMNEYFKTGVW
jgi:glutamate synthase (NADPH/NADH) small chain